ncbi:hypothetical protein JTE90_001128 [Oedothorax gibbosus]|uniref:Protein CASC3 n=1 Tax=Oedothorax gibbosus TaxID=931172 RepID=A0AAV6VH81_9ARAC|nr:hypothetical protein JTE90_001128 [Oedothorax gibbosus]
MADRRRRVKTDDDSEGSLTGSDVEVDEKNEAENSLTETPEKDASSGKVAEGSEYESAEEQTEKVETEASPAAKEPEESLSDVVDEEGGEEGIAESEDVEGDFLSGDLNEDASGESEEEEGEYVEEERQQGDGEECSPNDANEKELDFDEDRRNPQYIPKKGIFYEHDDRNNEEEKEKEEEPPRDRKKKLWNDEGKWGHDRFREEEQFPKSRNELIEAYGYDIRNEDGPPRARRRRRYGRGPMKYDRSWEDVTAYGREKFQGLPRGSPRGRRPVDGFRGGPRGRGRGRNHFDEPDQLHERHQDDADVEKVPVKDEETDEAAPAVIINSSKEFPSLPTKESPPTPRTETPPEQTYFNKKSSSPPPEPKSVRTLTFENSNYGPKPNSIERDVPPRRGKTTAPFTTDRGVRRPNVRGGRGMRGESRGRGRGNNMRQVSPRFMENKVGSLATDMEQLTVDNVIAEVAPQIESNGVSHPNNELPNMAHKGAGDSSGRPKRYSSLRQRSLPETNAYQPPPPAAVPQPHPTYYDAGYSAPMYAPTDTCVPTPSTQSQTVNSSPIMNPSYQTFTPPPYTESYGASPATSNPSAPSLPPSERSDRPAHPGPSPLHHPLPQHDELRSTPPPAGYQFAFQQYTTPPPPPPPAPPSDMYQTGITYYYPQSQAPPVRPTVQKRPKAAIPILPPPEREGTRTESKDNNHASSTRNFSDNSTNPEDGDVSIRTDSTQQLQTTVGVES